MSFSELTTDSVLESIPLNLDFEGLSELFAQPTTKVMADSSGSGGAVAPNGGRAYRNDNRDDVNDFDRHDWNDSMAPNLFEIVRYTGMSQRDANRVWMKALEDWDMDESTEDERRDLRRYLTACFCISTSKDDENLSTMFVTRSGKQITLSTLHQRAAETSATGNDTRLRMFVRSFEHGYFVRAQHTMLMDPANVELRGKVVQALGVDAAYAGYAFDTADYLVDANVRLSVEEMAMVTKFKALRTSLATASANAVGEYTAKNDTTSVNSKSGTRVRPSQAMAFNTAPLPSAEGRLGAANINLR